MNTKLIGEQLREKLRSAIKIKDLKEWAENAYVQYHIHENKPDTSVVNNLEKLQMLDKNTTKIEDLLDWLRVITDQMLHPNEFTLVQLGWGIREKLKVNQNIFEIHDWISDYLGKITDTDDIHDEVMDLISEIDEIHSDRNMFLTDEHLYILSKLLVYQEKRPFQRMQKIINENYSKKIRSSYYDLGCWYQQLLIEQFTKKSDVNIEKIFNLAEEYFTLARKQWDCRVFRSLGILYFEWAKHLGYFHQSAHYFKLAIDSLGYSLLFEQDRQDYFNLGIVWYYYAQVETDPLSIKSHYCFAVYYFEKALNSGITEASEYIKTAQQKLDEHRKK